MRREDAVRLLPKQVTVPSFRALNASVPLLKQWECSATSKDLQTATASRPQVPVPFYRTLLPPPFRDVWSSKPGGLAAGPLPNPSLHPPFFCVCVLSPRTHLPGKSQCCKVGAQLDAYLGDSGGPQPGFSLVP